MIRDAEGQPVTLPTLYKITGPNGEAVHGGSGQWSLPCYHDGSPALDTPPCSRPDHVRSGDGWAAPGEWWDIEGGVVPCRNALHLTDAEHFERWAPDGPGFQSNVLVHRAEVSGVALNAGDKWAVQSARLLPHSGIGAVDLTPLGVAARATAFALDLARDKADRALTAAVRKAERAERGVKVPPAWKSYFDAVGYGGIPAGHPARAYAESQKRIGAAERAAAQKRDAAVTPYLEAARKAEAALRMARKAARLAGI